MAVTRRSWTDYPPHYAVLAKNVATATLPALYGPFPKGDAFAFRRNFYRFREVVGTSAAAEGNPDSYLSRLYEMIRILSVKVELSTEIQNQYNVIFDLDPIVSEMDKKDPAAAQMRILSKANFAAAQRPANISSPLFSDEEMEERLKYTTR